MTPTFQGVLLRCAKCKHEWSDRMPVMCDFDVAIAGMRSLAKKGCPACKATGGAVLLAKMPYTPEAAP